MLEQSLIDGPSELQPVFDSLNAGEVTEVLDSCLGNGLDLSVCCRRDVVRMWLAGVWYKKRSSYTHACVELVTLAGGFVLEGEEGVTHCSLRSWWWCCCPDPRSPLLFLRACRCLQEYVPALVEELGLEEEVDAAVAEVRAFAADVVPWVNAFNSVDLDGANEDLQAVK